MPDSYPVGLISVSTRAGEVHFLYPDRLSRGSVRDSAPPHCCVRATDVGQSRQTQRTARTSNQGLGRTQTRALRRARTVPHGNGACFRHRRDKRLHRHPIHVEITFWALTALVLWAFVIYPTGMILRARFSETPLAMDRAGQPEFVSIVLAVRNEGGKLAQRVDNLLGLDYPPHLTEVLVVCNGCSDDTEAVARCIAGENSRVRVLVSPKEHGKSGAINQGVDVAQGRLLVFADARQAFARDALQHLLTPFRDPEVGVVSGRLVIGESDRPAVEGVRWYWGMETALRTAESRTGSVVGATGAIYAVRREAFEAMPPNLILDDVFVPLCAVMRGWRTVLAPSALAYDLPAKDPRAEFHRKRRTMVGNLQLLRIRPSFLLPSKNPILVRFVSHKLLRLTAPFLCIALVGSGLLSTGGLYHIAAICGILGYMAGLLGFVLPSRALSAPAAIVLIHAAVFSAIFRSRQDASGVWHTPGSARSSSPAPRIPVTPEGGP